MNKTVIYEVNWCNSRCPYFYFNYDRDEEIWCAKLNERIFNGDDYNTCDLEEREFPDKCPLDIKICCNNCRYKKDSSGKLSILCRRYPKEVFKNGLDWCGEHERY